MISRILYYNVLENVSNPMEGRRLAFSIYKPREKHRVMRKGELKFEGNRWKKPWP